MWAVAGVGLAAGVRSGGTRLRGTDWIGVNPGAIRAGGGLGAGVISVNVRHGG